MSYTKAEREKRWKTCIEYLAKHGSIPESIEAAHLDGISYNTSVWMTALGKMLEQGRRPGDRA